MSGRDVDVGDLFPRVDVEQATRHLELLHAGARGFVNLTLLDAASARRPRWQFSRVEELKRTARVSDDDTLQEVVDDRWNVYTACCSFARVPPRGRGSRDDVESVPGAWVDVDVKPGLEGFFQTETEAVAYLDTLPTPTLEISTGSGGRHAYWLLHPDERQDVNQGERLLVFWRDLLIAQANGYEIDAVQDVARVLRLAGTVRFPKKGENALPRPVRILREGPRYPFGELETLAYDCHHAALVERRERRANAERHRERHQRMLEAHGAEMFDRYQALVSLFNQNQDWAPMLELTGWTLQSQARDCRYWTRPGKDTRDGKSAATDYVNHEGYLAHVMTIYTEDPSLSDVVESVTEHGRKICSKWHYALRRLFDSDEESLIREAREGQGRLCGH